MFASWARRSLIAANLALMALVLLLGVRAFAATGDGAEVRPSPPRSLHVFILLGGLFGPDGFADSAGMWQLKRPLVALGAKVIIHNWAAYESAAAEINALPAAAKVALIGYSGGGSRGTWIMRMGSHTIDLMVLYDPSPRWQMYNPISTRVKRAFCYVNVYPFLLDLGGGRCVGAQVQTVLISEPHLAVQFDRALHRKTVLEVQRLLAQP